MRALPEHRACVGNESSIYVYTSCGQRLLQVGNDAVLGLGGSCVGFGSSALSIELGMGLVNVIVSRTPAATPVLWKGLCVGVPA